MASVAHYSNLRFFTDSSQSTHIPSLDDSSPSISHSSKPDHKDSHDEETEDEEVVEEKFDNDDLLVTHCPLLICDDLSAKREEIRVYFHKTFSLYEQLFTVLANDDVYYMQPEKLRHPLIFYYAHTACFFINKLVYSGILTQRINEHIESTCAIGVDEMCLAQGTTVLALQNSNSTDKSIVRVPVENIRAGATLVGEGGRFVTVKSNQPRDIQPSARTTASQRLFKVKTTLGDYTVSGNHRLTVQWLRKPRISPPTANNSETFQYMNCQWWTVDAFGNLTQRSDPHVPIAHVHIADDGQVANEEEAGDAYEDDEEEAYDEDEVDEIKAYENAIGLQLSSSSSPSFDSASSAPSTSSASDTPETAAQDTHSSSCINIRSTAQSPPAPVVQGTITQLKSLVQHRLDDIVSNTPNVCKGVMEINAASMHRHRKALGITGTEKSAKRAAFAAVLSSLPDLNDSPAPQPSQPVTVHHAHSAAGAQLNMPVHLDTSLRFSADGEWHPVHVGDATDVQVIYQLHYPLLATAASTDSKAGEKSATFTHIEYAMRLLSLDHRAGIMCSELSPNVAATSSLKSQLSEHDKVCRLELLKLLKCMPRSIVAFGWYARYRWEHDLHLLEQADDESEISHVSSESIQSPLGQQGLRVIYMLAKKVPGKSDYEDKRQHVLTVWFAQHPCKTTHLRSVVRALGTAHGIDAHTITTACDEVMGMLPRIYDIEEVPVQSTQTVWSLEIDAEHEYERRFALGNNTLTHNSWDDLNSKHYDWPTPQQVREYRNVVRTTVDDLISSLPLTLPITWDSPFWIILMGCEHERIHLETSSVLIRQLDIQHVQSRALFPINPNRESSPSNVVSNSLLPVPASQVSLGKSYDSNIYGWDLEYGQLNATVQEFKASKYLVSNAEFYEFVRAGGYQRADYWGDEGWRFVKFRNATCPVFWVEADTLSSGEVLYKYRTMTEIIDMPWSWPVDCNYIEAKAFCAWKNEQLLRDDPNCTQLYRLPTEEEWTALHNHAYPELSSKSGHINDQPYWRTAPGNINLEHGASSCNINEFEFDHGFFDVIGNVWQWCETPVNSFPGFKFHPAYDDFSVPTFDTRHNMIKGGSWISTGNEATRLARYAFRRHFYQHAGFRYVVGAPLNLEQLSARSIEKDPAVTQQIHSEYGAQHNTLFNSFITLPNYSTQIANIAYDLYSKYCSTSTALTDASSSSEASLPLLQQNGVRVVDFGCGTGRVLFEMAKLDGETKKNQGNTHKSPFTHLLGIDLSTRFIRIASQLQYENNISYAFKKEGELENFYEVDLRKDLDIDLEKLHMKDRLEFMQADVNNLNDKYSNFDVALVCNLLEYVAQPSHFLTTLASRMKSGGILLLLSTYDWQERYTARDNWLGGCKGRDGESKESVATIHKLFENKFTRIQDYPVQQLPIIVPNSSRNFQINIGHITVWKRL